MPTILRFRSFRIAIFLNDHPPPHVHVIRGADSIIFNLGCPHGPMERQMADGIKPAEERVIAAFLLDNQLDLCKAWEAMHGDSVK